MAKGARVVLRGRFSPGTRVRLVEVAGPGVLRAEGGKVVATGKVDRDGVVGFSGVKENGRYFIVGRQNGVPLEVRVRGRADGEDAINQQQPVSYDRVRLSDGSYVDEPPEQHQATPSREVAPAPAQHTVPKGTVQRSDTPRGYAHPHDPGEAAPYGRQEDAEGVQMSDTETGRAAPVESGPQRQDQVPAGVWQRSATPEGVATVIPPGDAVQVQRMKESSAAKERRGEPGRAAAEPLGVKSGKRSARKAPHDAPAVESQPGAGDASGLDAEGQPVAVDVAAASGVTPASKPAEARSTTAKEKK